MKSGSYLLNELLDKNKSENVDGEIQRLIYAANCDKFNIHTCLDLLNFKKDESILDIGCGPGSSTTIIRQYNKNGETTGVDREIEFINYATNNFSDVKTKFFVNDEKSLPFDDNTFDICYSRFLFQHLVDPIAFFKEICRVTKPNGRIGIYEQDCDLNSFYPEPRHFQKMIRAISIVQKYSGGDSFFGKKLFHMFNKAGVNDVKITRLFRDTINPGREAICQSLFGYKSFDETHPYVKMKIITLEEIQEYRDDLISIINSTDSFISFGGYFVYGNI